MAATTATSMPAFDRLRPLELAELLPALLAAHPEVAATLEQLAVAQIRAVDADVIARELQVRLDDLPLAELAARSGRHPGGYLHETDAAYEMFAEVVGPFEQNVWRAVSLGEQQAATVVLLGILDGLHRSCDAPDGSVLSYAGPDTPLEHASWLVGEARRRGIELDADEVESRCPEWVLLPDGLVEQ